MEEHSERKKRRLPGSTDTTPQQRSDTAGMRRLRLARATPEQLARARAKKRLQRATHHLDAGEERYISTQETISATPDDLTRSLKKRRRSAVSPSNRIPSLYNPESSFTMPLGVSTPVAEYSSSTNFEVQPDKASGITPSSGSPCSNSPRGRIVRSSPPVNEESTVGSALQYHGEFIAKCSQSFVPSSMPDYDDAASGLPRRSSNVDVVTWPEAGLDYREERSHHSSDRLEDYESDEEVTYIYDGRSDIPGMLDSPVGIKSSEGQDQIMQDGLDAPHTDQLEKGASQKAIFDTKLSTSAKIKLLKELMVERTLDCDQVRDLISLDKEAEHPVLSALMTIPPCGQDLAHRNAFRLVAARFIKSEELTKEEFLEYLNNDDQDILTLLWSKAKRNKDLDDLLDDQLRDISKEVYPNEDHMRELVGFSDTPEVPQISSVSQPAEAPSHQRHLNLQSNVNLPASRVSILSEQAHAEASLSAPVHELQPVPSGSAEEDRGHVGDMTMPISARSRRRTYDANKSNGLSNSPTCKGAAEAEQVLVSRQSHLQRTPLRGSFHHEAEARWRTFHAEHPDFQFRRGPLSRSEVDKAKAAVEMYRNEVDLSAQEFRVTLHDKVSRMKKSLWTSLIYCIPQRNPKNMREYFKKAYPLFSDRTKFTSREKDELVGLVREHGHSWAVIGELMGRYREDCQHVYLKLQEEQLCENINRGSWTELELKDFDRAVEMFDKSASIDWRSVAEMVGTRTAYQCRDHSRIHQRTDRSYLPGYKKAHKTAAASTPKARKESDSSELKSVPRSTKRKEGTVTSMNTADLLLFIDYLQTTKVDSLDVLPTELSYFPDKFGLSQLVSKLTTERKKIRHWRTSNAESTLEQMKSNLAAKVQRDRAPSLEL